MARHFAPFSCCQRMAESVRRTSWGGGLPLGPLCWLPGRGGGRAAPVLGGAFAVGRAPLMRRSQPPPYGPRGRLPPPSPRGKTPSKTHPEKGPPPQAAGYFRREPVG